MSFIARNKVAHRLYMTQKHDGKFRDPKSRNVEVVTLLGSSTDYLTTAIDIGRAVGYERKTTRRAPD